MGPYHAALTKRMCPLVFGAGHIQRCKQAGAHHIFEWLMGDLLDHCPGQDVPEIRIRKLGAGWPHQFGPRNLAQDGKALLGRATTKVE